MDANLALRRGLGGALVDIHTRHWLDYDFVALAVLITGISVLELSCSAFEPRREAQGSGFIALSDGNADMELSTSECRRFAQECRDLAKSAKTAEEIEFLC